MSKQKINKSDTAQIIAYLGCALAATVALLGVIASWTGGISDMALSHMLGYSTGIFIPVLVGKFANLSGEALRDWAGRGKEMVQNVVTEGRSHE